VPPKKPTPKPISLNEEQQAVVNAREGRFQILAGPGAGKTQAISMRYAALIREGVSPDDILSMSFTRTAATNLSSRVEEQTGKLSINRKLAGASTYHSFALNFILEERNDLGLELAEFPLAPEPTANRLSAKAASRFEVNPRSLRASVSLQKRNQISPSEAIRRAESSGKSSDIKLALAYKEYDKLLRGEGVLDFDGLMEQTVALLTKSGVIRDRHQFLYVMADESQDNSKIEWDLLKLLTQKHGNLLCVGDVSQCIYGFRGSDADLFANMSDMFPGTQTLFLACNYRSTPEIIDFIRPHAATQDLAAKFHTPNSHGPVPVIRGFKSPQEEAEFVVQSIKNGGGP